MPLAFRNLARICHAPLILWKTLVALADHQLEGLLDLNGASLYTLKQITEHFPIPIFQAG